MTEVKIYTDGSARGNPDGPGGYGVVMHYVDKNGQLHEKTLSAGYKKTTNNRMELMAAIAGLEALNRPCKIELYSDSKYLTDAFNKNWISGWIAKGWNRGKSGPVKNIDLWKRLLKAKEQHQVTFIWVKGHAGHPQNERCDQLATTAADGNNLIEDEGLSLWSMGLFQHSPNFYANLTKYYSFRICIHKHLILWYCMTGKHYSLSGM